jgi:hypothetical protein
MASSPSEAELSRFVTIGDIADWVGFAETENPDSVEAKLLEHLGITTGTPVREVGLISKSDYEQEIETWSDGGVRPSLVIRSKAKQIGLFARCAIGLDYTPEVSLAWNQFEARRISQQDARVAVATASAQARAVSPAVQPTVGKKVSYKIAIQERTVEVAVLSFQDCEIARRGYLKKMHTKSIPIECMPTAQQLSVLGGILLENSAPYVDFAIFGPFGGRVKKALSHKGLNFSASGSLVPEEFRGPPSIAEWTACWLVFQTGMIMLDAADHPQLEAYAKHIAKLSRQFGPSAWCTLYQADVRFRREMIERVREEQSNKLDEALEANGSYPFDPKRPWDRCFEVAVTGRRWIQYWADEVGTPCMLLLMKATGQDHFLGGDAEIASSSNAHLATRYSTEVQDTAAVPAQRGGGGGHANIDVGKHKGGDSGLGNTKPPKVQKQHHVSGNQYTANRSGLPFAQDSSKALAAASAPMERQTNVIDASMVDMGLRAQVSVTAFRLLLPKSSASRYAQETVERALVGKAVKARARGGEKSPLLSLRISPLLHLWNQCSP